MAPVSQQAFPGAAGEQLCLFDNLPFCYTYPVATSLAGVALAAFLRGESLTHPDFEERTGSWRLAAYIGQLKDLGWPIQSEDVYLSNVDSRTVARYRLAEWVIDAIKGAV